MAELGREGGRKNRHRKTQTSDVAARPLKSIGDVSELLEETINQVRQGQIDLRASNAIGFLAGMLLKALEKSRVEERLQNLEAILGFEIDQGESFSFRARENKNCEEPAKAPKNN
jgi:hypothetical protein